MLNEIEKVFFVPGDLVVIKYEELKSPIMLVQEKITRQFKQKEELCNVFKGMRCIWFDNNNTLQTAVFSTKDLKFYNKDRNPGTDVCDHTTMNSETADMVYPGHTTSTPPNTLKK